jgi:uncharacterized protein (TIGR02284 family)
MRLSRRPKRLATKCATVAPVRRNLVGAGPLGVQDVGKVADANFPKGFQMFDNKNVSTLNSLIATTLDSVDGYRKAADEANAAQFKDQFLSRANERQAVVGQFQAKVRELGGNPEDDGTVLASAHRAFLGLRDSLTGERDDKAVVAEVERGEDHIKAKFESALKDEDLDPAVRQLIQTGFTSVREGHDQMSALKHQLNAS